MLLSKGIDLKEQSPYGKPWGKCTKHELVKLIFNLTATVERANLTIYYRDLFYNGCHQIYIDEYKQSQSKDINKDKVTDK